MKTKASDETTKAFEKILDKIGLNPRIVMSDNDGAFMGDEFQKLLSDGDIIHDPNALNDHKALGIIDNFAKRIKLYFAKSFLLNNNKVWITKLDEFIKTYNESPHSSLNDLSPDEAEDKKNYDEILGLNIEKANDMIGQYTDYNDKGKIVYKNKTNLKVGDSVRVKIATRYTKGSDSQYSDKVYHVVAIHGLKIELDNNKSYPDSDVLKVNPNSTNITKNPIKHAQQEHKQTKILKKEDIRKENIVRTKRIKRRNQFFVD
jgi:hypothetical protein